jgi:RNA polymerase sigma factor (sigma-70 family)
MDLLERFARGDRDAFEALFREHQAGVYRWMMRIVRDHGTAEDLTMEAFYRAYKSHARFDPRRSFGAWMRRIASNLAFDHLRHAKRSVVLAEDAAVPDAPGAPNPPDPALRREQREQIASAFAQLSPKLRIVATLALIEDVPHAEIADALGISEGTVRIRVFRATQSLRENLKALGAHQ